MTNVKIGYSFSGGGSAGAYLVGAEKYFREELGIEAVHSIFGVSTGSLFGTLVAAAVVTGDPHFYEDAYNIYTSVKNKNILQPRDELAHKVGGNEALLLSSILQGRDSLYSTKPLQSIINDHISPKVWSRIMNSDVKLGFVCTSLQSGKSRAFTNHNCSDIGTFKKALIASANQPVFMEPIEIDGEQWVDGGLVDYNPIQYAINSDVDIIIAVSLSQGVSKDPVKYTKVQDVLIRTLQILTDNIVDEDIVNANYYSLLGRLKEKVPANLFKELTAGLTLPDIPKKVPKILHLMPSKPLPLGGLNFDPKIMLRMLKQGFKDASRLKNDLHAATS